MAADVFGVDEFAGRFHALCGIGPGVAVHDGDGGAPGFRYVPSREFSGIAVRLAEVRESTGRVDKISDYEVSFPRSIRVLRVFGFRRVFSELWDRDSPIRRTRGSRRFLSLLLRFGRAGKCTCRQYDRQDQCYKSKRQIIQYNSLLS